MPTQQLILAAAFLAALASAAWFAGLWLIERRAARRHRRVTRRTGAALDSAPGAFIAWTVDGEEIRGGALDRVLGGTKTTFATLCRYFAPDDAKKLTAKVDGVRHRGDPFSLTLTTRDGGRAFLLDGVRARASALDLLWVRDVTEQTAYLSDTALRQAVAEGERDALRVMVDALPTPVWRRGPDFSLAQVNAAYVDAVAGTRDQVLVDQPELTDDAAARARQAVESGTPQADRRHVVVAGERRLLEVVEAPGGDQGVVGYAIDCSAQEELEADLARHIEAHADVLENVAVAVAIYGPDTKLMFHNTAYARLWDMEPEFLDSRPSIDEELEHLRERRRLPEYVDFRAFRDDQKRLFTSLMQPLEDLVHLPDGRTLRKRVAPHPFGGLLFTYEDVTDSLTMERSYNTLIEVQSRTLDNLYEGVALIGADGRLKLCNPAYLRLWQLSQADVDSEPHIADLVDKTRALFTDNDNNWDALRERIIARATAREPRRTRLERTDGSVLESAIVPLPDGQVLLSYIDVTDRYRVERMLRERNDALQAADELKTEFIANVSYKLRTPLNTIIGFSEILNGDMFGELNERQAEYSDGILRSSEELLELINDILDLATIEAGYMELDVEHIDIREMLQLVCALHNERARQRQLSLACDAKPDIGTMTGDERRLKQVLFNLVSNAIKFTPAGGTIDVSAERDGADIVFTVADTGIGIPQQEHERVLKMFERGSYPNIRQPGAGVGLGLSLVKSFIELHGGTVELLSKPDLGTTVICRVPAAAARVPAPPSLEEAAAPEGATQGAA